MSLCLSVSRFFLLIKLIMKHIAYASQQILEILGGLDGKMHTEDLVR